MKGIEDSSIGSSSSSTWIKVGGALLREQHGHVPVDAGYRRAVYIPTRRQGWPSVLTALQQASLSGIGLKGATAGLQCII